MPFAANMPEPGFSHRTSCQYSVRDKIFLAQFVTSVQGGPAQHTVRGLHAARETFLNCRKCCKSSTLNKWLSLYNFFNTTTQISTSKLKTFAAPCKFMLIIWPFELSELCRPGLACAFVFRHFCSMSVFFRWDVSFNSIKTYCNSIH